MRQSGEILNVVSGDGDRVVDGVRAVASAFVPFLSFILSIIIGLLVMGWPSLLGNLIVLISIPIFMVMGKVMVQYRLEGSKCSGKRIEQISEILSSIKLIKMFNWEGKYCEKPFFVSSDTVNNFRKFSRSTRIAPKITPKDLSQPIVFS